MEVRPRYPACFANDTNLLTFGDRLVGLDIVAFQVKILGDQPIAVIDIYGVATVKLIGRQHYPAIGHT